MTEEELVGSIPPTPHPPPLTLPIKLLSQCREICCVLHSTAHRPVLLCRCVYLSGSAPPTTHPRRSSATCHRDLIYNAGVLLGPFQTMKLSVIFTPKGNLNIWSSDLMAGAFHHIVHNLDCYLGRVAGRVFTLGSAWVISTPFAILVSSDLRLSSWTMAAVYTLRTKILFILQKRCIL